MKKLVAFVAVVVFCAAAFVPGSVHSQRGKFLQHEKAIANHYIVVLEDWAVGARGEDSKAREVAEELAIVYGGEVKRVYKYALSGYAAQMTEAEAKALSEDNRVQFVEEDGEVYASTTQTGATWGLDRIDQRDRPLNGNYIYTPTGSGVKVYIIDTGIRRTHTQFGGRALVGFDAIGDGQNTNDCNGHGTHVAGTVGGSTYGVAKSVSLYAVRVLNCSGSGSNSGVIAGIDWVTANHTGASVANMSLGGGASTALDNAVQNSIASGVTYAVAAGNENQNACNVSPARAANAITVGSTTSTDARSSFSNFGTCVDIFAPGSSITSSWSTSDTATNTISGTSMASPHVAGVAALYLQGNPGASAATVRNGIVSTATSGRLTGIGTGSPNLLLYSQLSGGGGGCTFSISPTSANYSSSGGSGSVSVTTQTGCSWTAGSNATWLTITGGSSGSGNGTVSYSVASNGSASRTGSLTIAGQSFTVTQSGSGGGCVTYTGSLSGTGASQYQPNGSYYYSGVSGAHTGALNGPLGTDFDLYLQKWNGFGWSTVANSLSASSVENINYNGTSGYYRWRVYAYSGGGSYTLCIAHP